MANQYTKKAEAKKRAAAKKTEPKNAPILNMHVGLQTRVLTPAQVKLLDGAGVNSCTQKAIDRKLPHFTLLPGDNFTTTLVQEWIALATQHGTSPEKVADARALLKRIEDWRTEHPFACKIPN